MLLKAAINGARRADEHPRLPFSPRDQARDARACIDAGAHAIHAHVRNAAGAESLDAADVAAVVNAIRSECSAPLGVSTGAWIVPSPQLRVQKVRSWSVLPDFASVNFSEDGAVDVAQVLLEKGVAIEAGLASEHDASAFLASGLLALRILIEPQETTLDDALRNADAIERRIANSNLPRVLHGTGPTAWALFREAVRRGLGTRVGLEDMLVLPDGSPAPSNAAIVRAAATLAA